MIYQSGERVEGAEGTSARGHSLLLLSEWTGTRRGRGLRGCRDWSAVLNTYSHRH